MKKIYLIFCIALTAVTASALDNGKGILPIMGWNTWYQYTGTNANNAPTNAWNDTILSNTADAFCNLGFTNVGYKYIHLDAGWQSGRDALNQPIPSSAVFPGGIANVIAYIHSRGLKFGYYFNKGTNGDFVYTNVGSYGWFTNDVRYAATNGGDAIKCDESTGFTSPYGVLQSAAAFYGGWIYTNNSANLYIQQGDGALFWTAAPTYANAWRLAQDIMIPGTPVTFATITNRFYAGLAQAAAVGPGYVNDLDMVLIGYTNNPYYGPINLTTAEKHSYFGLWSMCSSPLILSCNVSNLSASDSAILTNADVISLDQDALVLCCTNAGSYFVKPLAGGQYAVAFLNISSNTNRVSINFSSLGLPTATMVHDCWNRQDLGVFNGGFSAYVAPHDCLIYILRNPQVTESFQRTYAASYPVLPQNLIGWYDASVIQSQNGAVITNWVDQSPAGTNSLQVNTIDSANPTLTVAGQNGLNVITFSGSADNGTGLLATNGVGFQGQFDVFAVFQTTSPSSQMSLLGWNTVGNGSTAALQSFQGQMNDKNLFAAQSQLTTSWTIYRWSITTNSPANNQVGQARNHWVNGRLDYGAGINPNPSSVTNLYVGTDFNNHLSNPWIGSMGEIRIYNVILNPAQAKLETSKLATKWGITVAP